MAKTGSIYDVVRATGFERVTFQGDAGAGCEDTGVCGYAGTVSYSIGGTPHGRVVLVRSRNGRLSGDATYRTHGTTRASVTTPGSDQTCTDTVGRRRDFFSLVSRGSRFQRLLFRYHDTATDYLNTRCAGPTERDAAEAKALPSGSFRARDFRAKRVSFR